MPSKRKFHTGLTGWPLEHSLSPRIHQVAFNAVGLVGDYRLYPVPPGSSAPLQLSEIIDQIRCGALDGINVTIPHKAQIHDLVDACTISAAAIGAVNTLYARDGRVIGENTDAAGFMKDVQAAFPGLLNREGTRRALILGAGGAARAVAYSLINCGWQVGIAARSLDQAISIADDFEIYLRSGQIEPLQLEAGAMTDYLHYHPIHLLVNATPVGMHPHIDESPWPDRVPFPDGACAYDLVYNPPWTQFTKKAKEAGLQAATGLGMLIEQAALSFELWTGRNAPRAAIRQGFVDWRSG